MLVLVIRTLVVYVLVIFSMRLMGKRQLGELQPTELVSTLLISNLASICIEDTVQPLLASVVPVLLIAVIEVFNSLLIYHSPAYGRLLMGKPVAIIRQGTIDQKALSQLRISSEDLLEALRSKDVFSPEDVHLALVETNGQLAIYPKEDDRNKTPLVPLIVDGCMIWDNFQVSGRTEDWVSEYLKEQNAEQKQIFLLLASSEEILCIRKEDC